MQIEIGQDMINEIAINILYKEAMTKGESIHTVVLPKEFPEGLQKKVTQVVNILLGKMVWDGDVTVINAVDGIYP